MAGQPRRLDRRMKTLKPMRIGVLTRVFENDQQAYLVVSLLAFFRLSPPEEGASPLLSEIALWKLAGRGARARRAARHGHVEGARGADRHGPGLPARRRAAPRLLGPRERGIDRQDPVRRRRPALEGRRRHRSGAVHRDARRLAPRLRRPRRPCEPRRQGRGPRARARRRGRPAAQRRGPEGAGRGARRQADPRGLRRLRLHLAAALREGGHLRRGVGARAVPRLRPRPLLRHLQHRPRRPTDRGLLPRRRGVRAREHAPGHPAPRGDPARRRRPRLRQAKDRRGRGAARDRDAPRHRAPVPPRGSGRPDLPRRRQGRRGRRLRRHAPAGGLRGDGRAEARRALRGGDRGAARPEEGAPPRAARGRPPAGAAGGAALPHDRSLPGRRGAGARGDPQEAPARARRGRSRRRPRSDAGAGARSIEVPAGRASPGRSRARPRRSPRGRGPGPSADRASSGRSRARAGRRRGDGAQDVRGERPRLRQARRGREAGRGGGPSPSCAKPELERLEDPRRWPARRRRAARACPTSRPRSPIPTWRRSCSSPRRGRSPGTSASRTTCPPPPGSKARPRPACAAR